MWVFYSTLSRFTNTDVLRVNIPSLEMLEYLCGEKLFGLHGPEPSLHSYTVMSESLLVREGNRSDWSHRDRYI